LDVQDSLVGELAIDKPVGDCADVAPCGFDRDLRPQLLRCDQIGEQRETWRSALGLVATLIFLWAER